MGVRSCVGLFLFLIKPVSNLEDRSWYVCPRTEYIFVEQDPVV
jgi:hypothetical protein